MYICTYFIAMDTVKQLLEDVAPFLSFSEISSSYFNKGRSWLFNKINENVINGVKYSFSRAEIDKLSEVLKDLSGRIANTSELLKQYSGNLKRQTGVYYTANNPFKHPLFMEWYNLIPKPTTIIEPFAGTCSIPLFLGEMDLKPQWKCYDIEPIQDAPYKTTKRNCIDNMPNGKAFITNPPYLAKNSAKRRGLQYPYTPYEDIYQYALHMMLTNGKYVAVILPESFITTGLFRERLFGVISLVGDFFNDTNCPVCLAMFTPNGAKEIKMYRGSEYLGDIETLKNRIKFAKPSVNVDWKFNVPQGSIGVKCTDGKNDCITFMDGDRINADSIIVSSRYYTRIGGLPDRINKDTFINYCNSILADYREKTHDVFLTSFKSRRTDGYYRRRIDFGTIKEIMDSALCSLCY